jgi:putative serine protease PepD
MTEDPSDGSDRPGRGSGRLWTDPREEDEHTPWLAPRADVGRPPAREHAPAAAPVSQRPVLQMVVLGTLVAFVLFGAGFLGSILLRGGDSGSSVAALPAAPGAAAPDARARAIRTIYARVSPSVVRIKVADGGAEATGTGFVIDAGGTIVTNAHVVGTADHAQVLLDDNTAAIDAEVLGTDGSSDLAVLRVDSAKTSHLRPLTLADSDNVKVGDSVVAIGYPLNLDRSVTAGIVSGVGRAIRSPNGFSIDKVIQTDAAVNRGNSGGPLLDSAGRVIGVNSQIATAGGDGNVGIAFAIPSNTVRQVVPRLERGGSIRRPYLGVTTEPTGSDTGALVDLLVPGGPAEAAGVRPGDVIVSVGGTDVLRPPDISTAISSREPGDEIDVEVQRGGTSKTLRVTLGTRPATVAPPSSSTGP